jgi:hypothetical protein
MDEINTIFCKVYPKFHDLSENWKFLNILFDVIIRI